jgi:hypothetical protein
MVREFVASLLILPTAGCSWLLDFSDNAIPKDAHTDAPYTQAECDYKEPNDSAATAALITPADTGPAAICASDPEDHDFYKFTVPAMTAKVELRVDYTNRMTGDVDLRLFDKTGTTVLAQSNSFGNEELIVCPGASPACAALAADDYVFEVFPAVPGSVNDYTFALTITPM